MDISWLLVIVLGCVAGVAVAWGVVMWLKMRNTCPPPPPSPIPSPTQPPLADAVVVRDEEVKVETVVEPSESGFSVKTEKSDKKVRLNIKEEPVGKRRVYFVVKCSGRSDVCVRLLPRKPLVTIFSHPKLSKLTLVDKGLYLEGTEDPLDLTLSAEEAGFTSFPEYNEGQEYVVEMRDLGGGQRSLSAKAEHHLAEDTITVEVNPEGEEEVYGAEIETPSPSPVVQDEGSHVEMSPEGCGEMDEHSSVAVETPQVEEEKEEVEEEEEEPHQPPISPLMLDENLPEEEQEEEEQEDPTTDGYAGGRSNKSTPTWLVTLPVPKPRRSIATPSPAPVYQRVELTTPPVQPLPWCPSEGNCYDINKEQHYTKYRHCCRIPNCTLAADPEHDVYFSHEHVAPPVAVLPPVPASSSDSAPVFHHHLG